MACSAYTAIVGDSPHKQRADVRCFTGEGIFQQAVMEAKRYKVLPHLFFPRHEVTIWIDGNIWLNQPPDTVAGELLGDADMAVFRHSYRTNVWEEFTTLKDDPRFAIPYLQGKMAEQRQAYREDGLPIDAPLFECNVLIRRNNERVRRLMEFWWAQICRWQWRDQVSFPYALWKHPEVRLTSVFANVRDHPLFKHVEQWPA